MYRASAITDSGSSYSLVYLYQLCDDNRVMLSQALAIQLQVGIIFDLVNGEVELVDFASRQRATFVLEHFC